LITGATDGLGRALAGRAHREGWDVLAHGRSDEQLGQLAGELDGNRTLRADLAVLADVVALAKTVHDSVPRLDVLVKQRRRRRHSTGRRCADRERRRP